MLRYYGVVALPCCVRDWAFVRSAVGKPRLGDDLAPAARVNFDLAHTDALVAFVVSRAADVGIDVERLNRVSSRSRSQGAIFRPRKPTNAGRAR
jgi:phosphopantetheinyl transferase